MTPELAVELHCLFTAEPSELTLVNGFYINRRQVFRGKRIRHGGYYPTYLLKLFRRGRSTLDPDGLVDHHLYVDGQVGKIRHDLIEDMSRENNISCWIEKHTRKEGFIFHFLQAFWFLLPVDINLDELQRQQRR